MGHWSTTGRAGLPLVYKKLKCCTGVDDWWLLVSAGECEVLWEWPSRIQNPDFRIHEWREKLRKVHLSSTPHPFIIHHFHLHFILSSTGPSPSPFQYRTTDVGRLPLPLQLHGIGIAAKCKRESGRPLTLPLTVQRLSFCCSFFLLLFLSLQLVQLPDFRVQTTVYSSNLSPSHKVPCLSGSIPVYSWFMNNIIMSRRNENWVFSILVFSCIWMEVIEVT